MMIDLQVERTGFVRHWMTLSKGAKDTYISPIALFESYEVNVQPSASLLHGRHEKLEDQQASSLLYIF